MKKKRNIQFLIKKSARAKRMRVAVYCDAQVVVTVPQGISVGVVEKFIAQKRDWIEEKIAYFSQFKNKAITSTTIADYRKYKSDALRIATERVEHFNQYYGFSYNAINVKDQKTRWGSCSRKGNLNFNYKIVFLPSEVRDYIIVHEICHLKEFNHSRKFWDLVRKVVPDYAEVNKKLRKESLVLG